jgi:hypothetical protein
VRRAMRKAHLEWQAQQREAARTSEERP